jgi:hypothetical protein
MSPYEQAFNRLRAAFAEMPGMRLRSEQLERLSGVGDSVCRVVLDDLVRAGFLVRGANGTYGRSIDLGRGPTRSPRAERAGASAFVELGATGRL